MRRKVQYNTPYTVQKYIITLSLFGDIYFLLQSFSSTLSLPPSNSTTHLLHYFPSLLTPVDVIISFKPLPSIFFNIVHDVYDEEILRKWVQCFWLSWTQAKRSMVLFSSVEGHPYRIVAAFLKAHRSMKGDLLLRMSHNHQLAGGNGKDLVFVRTDCIYDEYIRHPTTILSKHTIPSSTFSGTWTWQGSRRGTFVPIVHRTR